MSRRHDVVLIALPLLALSGFAVERAAILLESAVGVGSALQQLPLAAYGLVAATCLVGHEVLVEPPRHDA